MQILICKAQLQGLKIIEKARAMAKKRIDDNPNDLEAQKDYSSATQQVASMLTWIWSISREESDLQKVIVELRELIRLIEELRDKGVERCTTGPLRP